MKLVWDHIFSLDFVEVVKIEQHCTFSGGQFVEDVVLQLLHLDLETVLLLNELFTKIGQVRPLFSNDEIE